MTYTTSRVLPVPPEEAFALVTDPERLRRWKTVTASLELRAGGSYRWTISPGHVAAGTVREVEPGRRLVYGWGWEGSDDLPPDASTVTVTLEPVDGGTRVTLVHEGLDAEQAARHAEGWEHYLDRLQRLAETGDAGADPWAWAPSPLDPLVAAEAVLAALQPVLRRLTPADRPRPTPCTGLTCHDLVEHLVDSLARLGSMAGAEVAPVHAGPPEVQVSDTAHKALAAWRSRGLDGTVAGPSGEPPAEDAAAVLPVELLLHGWDLAQGSGQSLAMSEELVSYVAGLARSVVPAGRRGGAFAEEVEPPADSDALGRLAAYAGRLPLTAPTSTVPA